jgi:hypothetical protein
MLLNKIKPLFMAKSSVANAGWGLFTKFPLKEGEFVGEVGNDGPGAIFRPFTLTELLSLASALHFFSTLGNLGLQILL